MKLDLIGRDVSIPSYNNGNNEGGQNGGNKKNSQ